MSRRYLITCRDSGVFYSGIFNFVLDPAGAVLFDSLHEAYRELRESPVLGGEGFWVEPADWYLTPFELVVAGLKPECDEDPASCDCSFHENMRAAEQSHFDMDPPDMQQRILEGETKGEDENE